MKEWLLLSKIQALHETVSLKITLDFWFLVSDFWFFCLLQPNNEPEKSAKATLLLGSLIPLFYQVHRCGCQRTSSGMLGSRVFTTF